jgi:hypothetical protein
MNCLEFRRAIGAQPRQLDAEARRHRDECLRCADAHARALRFEAALDRGLAVPVPQGLADRILLGQTTLSRRQASGRRALVWRIAAGILLAVGVAGVGWLALAPRPSLAAITIEHLSHEPMALTARERVPPAKVRDAFARFGIALEHSPGDVHYLALCPIHGRRSLHLVLQKPDGAVTVMFVPGAEATRRDFADARVLGRELPLAGGALVMLAADRSDFDAIEAALRAAP